MEGVCVIHGPDRKGLRLEGFDYGTPGMYFVTICLKEPMPRFGVVREGELYPNSAGMMIADTWEALSTRFPSISLDAYIVMPDHMHAIIFLGDDRESNGEASLSDVLRVFKSVSTNRYIVGVKDGAWPRFDERL
jgi:putative transposase